MQTTVDACIRCGHDSWCHVLCAELIDQTQFINNGTILSLLLSSFCAEGLQIPQSIKAQDQIVTLTRLFIILPSECVLVTPISQPKKAKTICSVCNNPIVERYVRCWYLLPLSLIIVTTTVPSMPIPSVWVEERYKTGVSL